MGKEISVNDINFGLAVEAGRIGTWLRDLSTNLIFQSPVTSQILGHGQGETVIPFDYLFTYTHQEDLEKFGASLQPLIESGEPFDVEFRIWRPDGKMRWIATRGKSIKDETGKPVQVVGVMFDITEKKQAAERFRLLTEYSPEAIVVETNHRFVYANASAKRLLGLTEKQQLSDYSIFNFTSHANYDTVVSTFRSIDENRPASHLCEFTLKRSDGSVVDVQAIFGFLHWDGQAATQIMMRDITELKKTQREVQSLSNRLALIVEGTGEGIWEWNIRGNVFRLSGGFNRIIGREDAEVDTLPGDWYRIIHREDVSRVKISFQESVKQRRPLYGCEFRIKSARNEWKWVRARGVIVEQDDDGQPLVMAGTLTDITIRKQSDELAWKHANLDPLTSLPNRRLLRQRLEYDIQKSRHADSKLALLFIDLDGFKSVNDLYGQDAGDTLLIEAARRITACLRESDLVARVGADEFIALIHDMHRIDNVEIVCQEMLTRLSQAFDLQKNISYVSASIGVALYPFDATEAQELVRKAEQAKYSAKKSGKNRFTYFTNELDEKAHLRLKVMHELRIALSLNQFEVHYQPIVNLHDGKLVKAEALLRWNHPVLGSISPGLFIPLAEELGLIIAIGEWMCREAIMFCKECISIFGEAFQVGINMSPIQFMSDIKELNLAHYLSEVGLAGESVVIEITEGVLLNASEKVLERFHALRKSGIRMALDDFGTGYSSMSYLHRFDIDYIKIDKSFVQNVPDNPDSCAIAETIIAMAHRLKKKVIAEGIETEAQLAYLTEAGCDYGQGYLFNKAMPPADFLRLVHAEK